MSAQKVENNSHAVEGLAYSSVKPAVKEQLAKDPIFSTKLHCDSEAKHWRFIRSIRWLDGHFEPHKVPP